MSTPNFHEIVLPSNDKSFPENRPNKFKIQLPRKLHLDGRGWKVGLVNIIYPATWATLSTHETQFIFVYMKDGHTRFKLPLPKNIFSDPEHLERGLHLGMMKLLEEKLGHKFSRKKRQINTEEWEEEESTAKREKRDDHRPPPVYPSAIRRTQAILTKEDLEPKELEWLNRRRNYGQLAADFKPWRAELQLIGKLRIVHLSNISRSEMNRLVRWKMNRLVRWKMHNYAISDEEARSRPVNLDDLNFWLEDREKQGLPLTGEPETVDITSRNVAEARRREEHSGDFQKYRLVGERVQAAWGEAWIRLIAGKDPMPRARHLRDRDPFVFNLAMDKFQEKYKDHNFAVETDFSEFLETRMDEFETYYEEFEKVDNLEHLTDKAQKQQVLEIAQCLRFSWDDSLGVFVFHIHGDQKENVAYVTLTSQIAAVLGYDEKERITDGQLATYSPDLQGGVSHLYVYMNGHVAESMIVGSGYADLLRIVAVDAEPGKACVEKNFNPILFHPVVARECDLIDVEIRTATGRLVPFDFGSVILTIQFKKDFF